MANRLILGGDLQPIEDVRRSIADLGDRYRQRVFTNYELEHCPNAEVEPEYLAELFCAKEATLKLLESTESLPLWTAIEVRLSASGEHELVLRDGALDLAQRRGAHDFRVSLSHENGIAAALVTASLE